MSVSCFPTLRYQFIFQNITAFHCDRDAGRQQKITTSPPLRAHLECLAFHGSDGAVVLFLRVSFDARWKNSQNWKQTTLKFLKWKERCSKTLWKKLLLVYSTGRVLPPHFIRCKCGFHCSLKDKVSDDSLVPCTNFPEIALPVPSDAIW